MEKKLVEQYKGRHVRLILSNGNVFHGLIESCLSDHFVLLDKFKCHVNVGYESIGVLQEAPK